MLFKTLIFFSFVAIAFCRRGDYKKQSKATTEGGHGAHGHNIDFISPKKSILLKKSSQVCKNARDANMMCVLKGESLGVRMKLASSSDINIKKLGRFLRDNGYQGIWVRDHAGSKLGEYPKDPLFVENQSRSKSVASFGGVFKVRLEKIAIVCVKVGGHRAHSRSEKTQQHLKQKERNYMDRFQFQQNLQGSPSMCAERRCRGRNAFPEQYGGYNDFPEKRFFERSQMPEVDYTRGMGRPSHGGVAFGFEPGYGGGIPVNESYYQEPRSCNNFNANGSLGEMMYSGQSRNFPQYPSPQYNSPYSQHFCDHNCPSCMRYSSRNSRGKSISNY